MENTIINKTTLREDGRSDLDKITANNLLAKQKNNMRLAVSAIVAVVGGLLLTLLLWVGLGIIYKGIYMLFPFIIAFVIGYFVSESIVKLHFGNSQAGGEAALTERVYTYTISDRGIKAEYDYKSEDIAYGDITSVTSNSFFYYLHTAGKRYQLAKNGFDGEGADFEQLIKSKGFTIGIEP